MPIIVEGPEYSSYICVCVIQILYLNLTANHTTNTLVNQSSLEEEAVICQIYITHIEIHFSHKYTSPSLGSLGQSEGLAMTQ